MVDKIPAAQYLRMSTEHQHYSLDNQNIAIHQYAEENGFLIVQTYADNSRSGIVLKHRDGLRQLLNDVVTGAVSFKAILVYDVSRWGRFQDTDEAAHYEFLCRSAGIPVHYCAEPFTNDGTITNTLLKTIKRTMAAEYSREMGIKIAAGQKNVFVKGFRGGGALPGFGLRRMLVSGDGTPKQILAAGERKAIQTDRVILVPGPAEELAWVREIFRLFVEDKYSYRKIAEALNRNHVPYRNLRPWDLHSVKRILTNGKYNGWLTYGKWTRRLHTKCRKTPESQWLVVPHPSSKIVDDMTFGAAHGRIESFTVNKSDEQLLDELRGILASNGKLSSHIITRTPGATPPLSYRCRFGSLLKAFQLIGYTAKVEQLVVTRRRVQEMRAQFMQKLQQMFPQELSIRGRAGNSRSWLRTRSGAKISVRFCIQPAFVRFKPAWRLNRLDQESTWTTLTVLLNKQNTDIERLLLYPAVPKRGMYVPIDSPWLKQGIEITDLQNFSAVVKQILATRRLKRSHTRK